MIQRLRIGMRMSRFYRDGKGTTLWIPDDSDLSADFPDLEEVTGWRYWLAHLKRDRFSIVDVLILISFWVIAYRVIT